MVDDYIELNTFVKLQLLATTGGQAKVLIRSGALSVNGAVETRNKRKLHAGDIVQIGDKSYTVQPSCIRPHKTI